MIILSRPATPVKLRSAQSTPSKVEAKSGGLRLVNYHDDTVISDDENENDSPTHEAGSPMDIPNDDDGDNEKCDENGDAIETKAKKDRFAEYGFQLPPEPKGKCPADMQEKIADMYDKMKMKNMDMNKLIQERKEFRNPSIYEKLIQFCEIDELGTNYPPELYDPMQWTSMFTILPSGNWLRTNCVWLLSSAQRTNLSFTKNWPKCKRPIWISARKRWVKVTWSRPQQRKLKKKRRRGKFHYGQAGAPTNRIHLQKIEMGSTCTERHYPAAPAVCNQAIRTDHDEYNWHQRHRNIGIWIVAEEAEAVKRNPFRQCVFVV